MASGQVPAELVGRLSLQRVTRSQGRSAGESELRELLDWTGAHRVIIEPQTLPPQDASG
jgi:hypothetical protein